jgi:hypothetical protein
MAGMIGGTETLNNDEWIADTLFDMIPQALSGVWPVLIEPSPDEFAGRHLMRSAPLHGPVEKSVSR